MTSRASPRATDNLLALAVLAYLTRGPAHAYKLSRMLRDHGDDRSIRFKHGSLYMVVRQLAKAGLIEELGTDRESRRPERTTYALTEAGQRELAAWLRELVEQPHHEYPRFVAGLAFIAALAPAEVARLLEHRLGRLAEERTSIQELIDSALASGVHPLFLVEEEYRVALLDADARFVRDFLGRIADPKAGWAAAWNELHTQPQRSLP